MLVIRQMLLANHSNRLTHHSNRLCHHSSSLVSHQDNSFHLRDQLLNHPWDRFLFKHQYKISNHQFRELLLKCQLSKVDHQLLLSQWCNQSWLLNQYTAPHHNNLLLNQYTAHHHNNLCSNQFMLHQLSQSWCNNLSSSMFHKNSQSITKSSHSMLSQFNTLNNPFNMSLKLMLLHSQFNMSNLVHHQFNMSNSCLKITTLTKSSQLRLILEMVKILMREQSMQDSSESQLLLSLETDLPRKRVSSQRLSRLASRIKRFYRTRVQELQPCQPRPKRKQVCWMRNRNLLMMIGRIFRRKLINNMRRNWRKSVTRLWLNWNNSRLNIKLFWKRLNI